MKPAPTWLEEEPGFADARADARRALAAARRRWIATLLIAGGATALAVYHRITHPPRFDASIVVGVTERGFDETTKPPSTGELDRYVHEVFLARSTLVSLIEELDLYPDKMTPDRSLALEAMADDLEVRVGQNYFDAQRSVGVPVRSARIVIAYRGRTPEHAHATVRRLAERFAEDQSRRRTSAVQAAALRTDKQEEQLRDQVRELAGRQATLGLSADRSPLAIVRLGVTAAESKALEARLDGASRERASAQLRDSLEEQRLGMDFALVEVGARPTPPSSRAASATLTGMTAFAVFLPLSILGVGILPRAVS